MLRTRPNLFQREALKNQLENKTVITELEVLKREHQLADGAIRTLRAAKMCEVESVSLAETSYLGQHMLAEFKVSDYFRQLLRQSPKPEKILHQIILDAALISGAHTLTDTSYIERNTLNIGVVVPVEESHYAAHYRADSGYLALDAFTCGQIDFLKAVEYIKRQIDSTPYDVTEFKRGLRDHNGDFIPGIAIADAENFNFFKNKAPLTDILSLGQHMIAEFYFCNTSRINNPQSVLETFVDALEEAGLTVRYQFVHRFQPQGVTAVVTGDGYHYTIHDWPENGYASIDLCYFGPQKQEELKKVMDKVMGHVIGCFDPRKVSINTFPRGNISLATLSAQPVFAELGPMMRMRSINQACPK